MRCPNPDCGEVFTVEPEVAAAPVNAVTAPKPSAVTEPVLTSGRLTDFVPMLEVESAQPAPVLEVEPPFRFEPGPAPVRVVPPPQPAKLLPPVAPAPVKPVLPPEDKGPREMRW